MPKIILRPNPTPPPFVPPTPPTPTDNVLTLIARQANSTVQLTKAQSIEGVSLEYSVDNGNTYNAYEFGSTITLENIGDSIKFRGQNESFSLNQYTFINFVLSGEIDSEGDVTSLLNGVGGNMALPQFAFASLFKNCTGLVKSPRLPSTTLGDYCYDSMFQGCASLLETPTLPATTLAKYCYSNMFSGCTSITEASQLPALEMQNGCYMQMFRGCTNLVTPPALPAEVLADQCYHGMFYNCTSLSVAPSLPATNLAHACYRYMFNGCTNLVTPPALPATTLAVNCYFSMFYGCTSLTVAPDLLALGLVSGCYVSMFDSCYNLSYIKALFVTTPNNLTTLGWVRLVSPNGTFVKNANATWTTTGQDGVPSGWTIVTE